MLTMHRDRQMKVRETQKNACMHTHEHGHMGGRTGSGRGGLTGFRIRRVEKVAEEVAEERDSHGLGVEV